MTVTDPNSGRKVSLLTIALLAIVAVSVIGASGAQAADWHSGATESGSTFTLSGTSSETIAGTGSFSVAGTWVGTNVEVSCSAASSGSIAAGGSGSESIGLSRCAVSKPKNCEAPSGTLSGSIQLTQAAGEVSESLVPKLGQSLGEIEFRGIHCSLDELLVPVNGSIVAIPPQGNLQVTRSLVISSGSETWLGSNPSKRAVVGGKVEEHLTGSNSRGAWGSTWEGTHGAWQIRPLSVALLSSRENVSVSGSSFDFQAGLSGTSVGFGCTGVEGGGINELIPGGTENLSHLVLSGCVVSQPSNCTVPNPLVLSPLTGALQSIGGQTYEKFSSSEGRPLFELEFSGSNGPLAGIGFPVTGSFAGVGPTWPILQISQGLEVTTASNKAAGAELHLGGRPGGEFTGSFSQRFTGARTGQTWAAY
jgi:hypothetical protein